ncbi:MAG: type II toxin-antitoxin system ParD family antitoxin [Gammaproteobacteria bacterium]|nr:type II toxin-antitoxin system ParD family antitoxin [Kiritimatiellia bacterium]NKB65155.1 type II toxin-antitoxin system ParD family antitoxin [Gammaproteobacteria bacterium]
MSKSTSIKLGSHFESYVANKVKAGRYSSVSDVVREGLRRLETDDVKLEALRTLLEEREQQVKEGRVVKNFSYDSLMKKIDEKVAFNKS